MMGPSLEDDTNENDKVKTETDQEGDEPKDKNNKISLPPNQTEAHESEKGKDKKEKSRPPTKIVIRRLPPSMNEETFLAQVDPLPDFDYMYFVRADMSLAANAFSRAYINIINEDDIFTFKEKFDNYIFVDKKGSEYPAVVEFAPYQRLPKKIPRKDVKAGTIEEDPSYLTFLKELEEENKEKANPHAADYSYQPADYGSKTETTTPLLEFLKNRRAEKQRIRDERREDRRRKEIERKKIKDEEKRKKRPDIVREGDSKQVLRNSHNETPDASKSTQDGDVKQVRERKREDERLKYKADKKIAENRPRDRHDHQASKTGLKSLDSRSTRKFAEDQRRSFDDDLQRKRSQPGKITESRRGQDESRRHQSTVTEQRKQYERSHGREKDKERNVNESDARKNYTKESIAKRTPREKKTDLSKLKESTETKVRNDVESKALVDEWNEAQLDKTRSRLLSSRTSGQGGARRFSLEDNVPHETCTESEYGGKTLRKSADDLEKLVKDSPMTRLSSEDYKKDCNTKLYSTRFVKSSTRKSNAPISNKPRNMSMFLEFVENSKTRNSNQQQENAQRRNSLESSEIEKHTVSGLSLRDASDAGPSMRRNLSLELETGSWGDRATLSRETSMESSSEDRKDVGRRSDKRSDARTKKDPREERRIRNKDRPSIEIYRPGMGRFSRQRIEREKEQESSQSPSPTLSNRQDK